MAAPAKLQQLVKTFHDNADAYRSADYNEEMLRHEFLNPMFKCLGWDMENEQGYAEAYKDVIYEGALKVGGATKAPDYCFRIGGTRKFFLEAKKPGVNIKDDPAPAYQLRRYAWSAKLPLSILTDFEEFAVYDCRTKPGPNDKPSVGRTLYLKYTEYGDRWDEFAAIFSRDAILKGSFDKYAETAKGKRGTATVDAAFLEEIESWRELLAKNIALRNDDLSQRDLNYAVQVTIDRIIFLRMCEDRGIERYGELQSLLNAPAVYGRLKQLFRNADDRYNSGLFYFQKEKNRAEPPDELTPALAIDDKPLKDIIASLYYPESPYEFSVLSGEILGQVYEQFLGKVIRLTAGHQAKVEDKPEVRKAGGVYYTPAYIVEYIVKHTVGKLLGSAAPSPTLPASGEGASSSAAVGGKLISPRSRGDQGGEVTVTRVCPMTTKQAAKLRILDPACGSGSFLLGAYQYLLDWHRDWYVADGAEKHAKEIYQGPGGAWRLTTAEKKRILLNNIYGVDIDPQAVEVTKLSLLLKVLEGESQETLERQRRIFHERALPDLASNIKCGNSLIGPDFYNGQQMMLFDEEERFRINVFDWNAAFPKIMKAGGFDAVIGNPPYVLLQDEFRDDRQLAYFRAVFDVASYKLDTYHLFIERAVRLTRKDGRCSMITPANFLTNNFLVPLRRFLLEHSRVEHIVVLDAGVFDAASVDNCVFVVTGSSKTTESFILSHASRENGQLREKSPATISRDTMREDFLLFTAGLSAQAERLWHRIAQCGEPLGKISHINFGKQLRDRTKFQNDVIRVRSIRGVPRRYRACYTGRDVYRYRLDWGLLACLDDEVAQRGGCWEREKHDAKNKLVTRQIGRYPEFALDNLGYQCLNTMFMINLKLSDLDARYLLGILNSKLLRAFWSARFYDRRRTFPKIKGTYLKQLPVVLPDSSTAVGRGLQNRMTKLVAEIIALNQVFAAAKTPHSRTALEAQIAAADRQIDRLVYELYGLTEDEIKIVEEATAK